MDAFLYPELLYGSVAASSSLFKVSSNHFEAASNSNNKRFVNLNHKIKLNPVEAQKLNSELLKFNYGSKKEVVGGNCNTNRRNSNATEISISSQPENLTKEKSMINKNGANLNVIGINEKILTEMPDKTSSQLTKLTKVASSLTTNDEQQHKSNINGKSLNKSDPSLNINNNNNGASILADLNRQSLEINPITVDLQTNNVNSNGNGINNKRYFYRYLLNKKYNSSNLPQQIFANVVPVTGPTISTNNSFNKHLSTTTTQTNNNVEFQSSSSFSIRSQPKEYLMPNVLNEQQIEPNGGVKFKLPAYQSQPNMMEFVEGAKLITKSDEIASRKLTFKETFGNRKSGSGGGIVVVKNKEPAAELNSPPSSSSNNNNNNNNNSSSSQSQGSQTQQQTPFQTQFRLKPLQVNKNNNNLDLCDDSSPFINLKIEKKPATRVERVPIKLRTLNKFEDLTITSSQNISQINNTCSTNNINTTGNSTTPPITQNVNSKTKLAKLNTTIKQKFTSSYSSFNRFTFDEKEKEKLSETNLIPNKPLENKANITNPNLPIFSNTTTTTNNNNSHRPYGLHKPFNSKLDSLSNCNFFDIEFTRVASPHVLGKSTNDFKFISNSSVNLNTQNRMRLNQHFEMFQSNLYDTNPSLLNNNLNLNSTNNNCNNSSGGTGPNKIRNEDFSAINNDNRKLSRTFNLQKLNVFGNCLS